ncbi:hypothetical protein [Ekhidna sp.]
MGKKKKVKKETEESKPKEKEESLDKGGFPEDIDFKRFLGCGG